MWLDQCCALVNDYAGIGAIAASGVLLHSSGRAQGYSDESS